MCFTVSILVVVLLRLGSCHGQTIVGYDCTKLSEISAMDLTTVEPCQPPRASAPPNTTQGFVLHRGDFETVPISICKAHFVQSIVRCGMHSHAASPIHAVTTSTLSLSREACLNAVRHHTLRLHDTTIPDVKINSTTTLTVTVAGSKGADGSCYGARFQYRGVAYEYVTVEREYTIFVSTGSARYDITSNTILSSAGVSCPFNDLHCFDAFEGNIFWEPLASHRCPERGFRTVYSGPVDVVTRPTAAGNASVQFAVVTAARHLFALRLLSPTQICGSVVSQTEHPNLFVFFGSTSPFEPADHTHVDLVAYVNSKFLYSEIRLADRSTNISSDAVYRRCLLERSTLRHQLRLARDQPELISQIFQKPGVVGRAVGEVLYLARCAALPLLLRRTDTCYDGLPATDPNNATVFVQPITHIILPSAEPVPCDGPFTPQFEIGGTWFRFTPDPVRVPPPNRIKPESPSTVQFEVLEQIGIAGLYSSEDVARFSQLLVSPSIRSAVTNSISRAATGDLTQSEFLTLPGLFTPERAAKIVKTGLSRLWGWFGRIGEFFSSVIGIIFVLKVVQFILKTLFNGLTIARVSGCGLHLLLAFWTSATQWLVRDAHTVPVVIHQPSMADLVERGEFPS